ncbi:MAG TPA: peptide ABC transporter permease [Opitutae bacterium]|nr:peptide ABC transporter permease [Opitutae bacterium]
MIRRRTNQEVLTTAKNQESSVWRSLRGNRTACIAAIVFFLITLLCWIGPIFSPYSYEQQDLISGAHHPCVEHWFGTDELGRDLLVRVLIGGRISIGVGFAASVVALVIGVSYGLIAGTTGGRTDSVLMRFVDAVYALPFTMIVIILTVTFDKKSIFLIFMAIGLVEWLTMARIVRAQTKVLCKQAYLEAAKIAGSSHLRILTHHLLPNLIGPVIIYTTLTIPSVILIESVLSFLGLGVQPPMSSWGTLINEGARKIDVFPWLLIFPALVFSLTLFALNFLGDGLRDAFDPKDSSED